MDHNEAFFFDTNGYLLLKGVMDPEWLAEAREAISAHEEPGVTGDGYGDPTASPALRGRAGVEQTLYTGGSPVSTPGNTSVIQICQFTHPCHRIWVFSGK